MIGKRAWMAFAAVLGVALYLAGCELPMNPVEIEVTDGSTYGSPQDGGSSMFRPGPSSISTRVRAA